MGQKTIITIGRQYGSGGHEVGKLLAQRLNIAFYDKEILMEASKNSDIDENLLKSYDESPVDVAAYSMNTGAGANYNQPMSEKIYLAEFHTIRQLANEKSCVFVGRCADYVLKGADNCINIFIHAPLKERIKRVCKRDRLEQREAEIIIRKMDKEREKYYNFYTNRKWGDASNYNMAIDTERIGPQGAVDLIERFLNIANG